MARKKGQTYSAEQKAKIVLELLKEEQTIGQLATKYKVTAKSIINWKKQFLENASKAFEDSASAKEQQKELEKLRQENDELAKTLGRTTVERDWAVGKLKSLDLSNKKSLVNSKLTLPKTRRCQLLGLSRASFYYKPRPTTFHNKKILDAIDAIYTKSKNMVIA